MQHRKIPDFPARRNSARLARRRFLGVASRATAGVVATAWGMDLLAAPHQSAPAPNVGAIIDAHIHCYDPTRPNGVPWPPRSDKLLYRRVMPEDYKALRLPAPATGAVVVEASPWIEDNQWILNLAQEQPFILGCVGNLPVGTKEFAAHLKRFAAHQKFRGVRIRDRKLAGLANDAAILADLKLLADQNLSLDLAGGPEILAFADQLAATLKSLRIIIDHLAGVRIDGKSPPDEWLAKMKALADRRNVYCKLSGLVEGTGRTDGSAPREVDFYVPVLTAMLEMFGADRLIYASNWPVSERYSQLSTVQSIVSDFISSRERSATARIFFSNAKAAYALG